MGGAQGSSYDEGSSIGSEADSLPYDYHGDERPLVVARSSRDTRDKARKGRDEREDGARPLLRAVVEDVAWMLGVGQEEDDQHDPTLVRKHDGSWVPAEEATFALEDLPKAFCVFREGLFDNPDVRVRIGPVVGKVTDTSAVILVEMDNACDLVVNIARVSVEDPNAHVMPGPWPLALPNAELRDGREPDSWQVDKPLAAQGLESMTFVATGSLSVCHGVEAKRPYTFVFEGLIPNTAYLVLLSNVCQEDLDRCVARFRTLPEVVNSLRLVVCSGHHPPLRAVGAANPWQQLHGLACEREVNITLHVGSTVDLAPAADEAARQLTDLQSFTKGARKDLERRARETLRAAYWEAWGRHEPLRRVLAEVGSHLPIFAPPVDLNSLRPSDYSDAGAAEDRQTLLSISLDVYREYQRSLWHSATFNGRPDVRVDARDDTARRKAGVTVRGGSWEDVDDREYWTHYGTKSVSTVEEWHIHRYGHMCILVLDTKGSFLSRGGKSPTLLSALQTQAFHEILRDPFYRVLVLACDIPFVLDQHPEYHNHGTEHAPLSWAAYPKELTELLENLFEWKHKKYPEREVVLVSSGPGFGTTGDVCDHTLGLSIPAVITGPMLGRVCAPTRWMLQNTLPGGRFSYVYRSPVDRWNFCTVDIDLAASQHMPTVEVQLVDAPVPHGTTWPDGGPSLALQ